MSELYDMEVIYTWPDSGKVEVRYRRPFPSAEADKLMAEVSKLKDLYHDTPYDTRFVPRQK